MGARRLIPTEKGLPRMGEYIGRLPRRLLDHRARTRYEYFDLGLRTRQWRLGLRRFEIAIAKFSRIG